MAFLGPLHFWIFLLDLIVSFPFLLNFWSSHNHYGIATITQILFCYQSDYQALREYPETKWAEKAKEPKSTYSIREWKEHWKRINKVLLESLKSKKKSIKISLFKCLYGINTKRLKPKHLNSSYLWHCCLTCKQVTQV